MEAGSFKPLLEEAFSEFPSYFAVPHRISTFPTGQTGLILCKGSRFGLCNCALPKPTQLRNQFVQPSQIPSILRPEFTPRHALNNISGQADNLQIVRRVLMQRIPKEIEKQNHEGQYRVEDEMP